jgi:hypothetical protein
MQLRSVEQQTQHYSSNKNITSMLKKRTPHVFDTLDQGDIIAGILSDSVQDPAVTSYFEGGNALSSHHLYSSATVPLDFFHLLGPIHLAAELLTAKPEHQARIAMNLVAGSVDMFIVFNQVVLDFTTTCLASFIAVAAAPAAILVATVDLINAALDLNYASEEMDFMGWLQHQVQEINLINQKITKAKLLLEEAPHGHVPDSKVEGDDSDSRNECDVPNSIIDDNDVQFFEIAAEIDKLIEQKNRLLADVVSRSRVYLSHNPDKFGVEAQLAGLLLKQDRDLVNAQNIDATPTADDLQRNAAIQQRMINNFDDCRAKFNCRLMCFLGASLLSLAIATACPPLALAGAVVGAIASLHYLYHNSNKIMGGVKQLFFKNKVNKPTDTAAAEQNRQILKAVK